jgi:predicted AAA+ superfamily ATPase
MYGMTVAEQRGRTGSAFLDRIVASDEPKTPKDTPDLRGYVQLALRSGFPEVLRPGLTGMQQERWLESYVDQLVTRDAREAAGARDPVLLRRFLDAYALSSAGITESKRIYDAAGISRPTGLDYERLLLNLWVIDNVPAWTQNRLKRLVRAPKRYFVDPGLMAATLRLGVDDVLEDGDLLGRVLDTFVTSQLRAEAAWATTRPRLFHLRDQEGRHEVDLVAELRGRRIVGIEVKASGAPGSAAARHLVWLRDQIGKDFHRGVVFHTGPRVYELDDRIVAMPIAALW